MFLLSSPSQSANAFSKENKQDSLECCFPFFSKYYFTENHCPFLPLRQKTKFSKRKEILGCPFKKVKTIEVSQCKKSKHNNNNNNNNNKIKTIKRKPSQDCHNLRLIESPSKITKILVCHWYSSFICHQPSKGLTLDGALDFQQKILISSYN